MRRPDVAVIGGGVIGLACARALLARGLSVTLLEAGELAREASWASAGMLAPLAELPAAAGPFATLAEVCRDSRDLWTSYAPELAAESGIDLDYDRSGSLALPDAPGRLAALEAAARTMGEPCRRLGADEARELVPGLSPDHQELLLLPGEHRVDNRAVCAALAVSLERRGAELRRDWPVAAVEARGGGFSLRRRDGERLEAGRVLLAAGAWSGLVAGLPALPVVPVHGQMMALGEVDWPWPGCLRGEHFYAVRRAGGRLLVGATSEELGFAARPNLEGLTRLALWTAAHFPGLAAKPIGDVWSGLRPATPDRLPLIGELPPDGGAAGILVATAHFRNGILLAPWTAERIAELAAGGRANGGRDRRALELFSPGRETTALSHPYAGGN
jgi:glycine oxidase